MNKVLDILSYSLLFTAWIVSGIARGEVELNLFGFVLGNTIAVVFLIFISSVGMIGLMTAIHRFVESKIQGKKSVLIESMAIALLCIGYTYIFFATSRGWIGAERRGIAGGLGSFTLDLIAYFLLALLARPILWGKKKLHRYVNTSVILFLVVIAIIFIA